MTVASPSAVNVPVSATVGEFLRRDDVTPAEKLIIKWQFGLCGGFERALWGAIAHADHFNLDLIEAGFPLHIEAFRAWSFGDPYSMGRKLREMGLPI